MIEDSSPNLYRRQKAFIREKSSSLRFMLPNTSQKRTNFLSHHKLMLIPNKSTRSVETK